jgi:hypothetical protein
VLETWLTRLHILYWKGSSELEYKREGWSGRMGEPKESALNFKDPVS